MERIGFIGLGIMGKPMARNLMKAGYPLVVHNRSRGAVDELCAEGASAASSPRETAESSDVVITMLPDSPDVEAVVLGEHGVIEGVRQGMLFIDMSTVAPATARAVAKAMEAKGTASLDAPVSGGDVGATEGTLSIMAGGGEDAFARALPLFSVMGKSILRMGEAGAGQVTKACNQVVVAITIQAVAEGMALARKAGVDPGKVRDALMGGLARSRILERYGTRMIEGNFQPGFRIRLHRKDLGIALQTGREVSQPLMATAQVAEFMNALLATGRGDLDHSALGALVEELGSGGSRG